MMKGTFRHSRAPLSQTRSQEVAASYTLIALARIVKQCRPSWRSSTNRRRSALASLRALLPAAPRRAASRRNFAKISEQSAPFTTDPSPRPFDSAVPETAYFLPENIRFNYREEWYAKPSCLSLSPSIPFLLSSSSLSAHGCSSTNSGTKTAYFWPPAAASLPVGGYDDFRGCERAAIGQR